MSGSLALALCVLFLIWIFRREIRYPFDVSPAIWLPTLWLMRCSSRSLAYWFGDLSQASVSGSSHDRIFFSALTLIGIVVLIRRRIDWNSLLRQNWLLLTLFVYMALSIIWSDASFLTFKRYIRAVGDITMVLVVVTDRNALSALLLVMRRTCLLLVPLSVVLSKYYGAIGRKHEKMGALDTWIGVTPHKNNLGQLCILAAVYFSWHWLRTRRPEENPFQIGPLGPRIALLYLAMVAYLVMGGGQRSMTAVVLSLGLVGLLFYIEHHRGRLALAWQRALTTAILVLALHFTVVLVADKPLHVILIEMTGRDPTLTDRTMLWNDLLELGERHHWLGAGFASFWSPEIEAYLEEDWSWGPTVAHNGYLEAYLNLGVIGLFLILALTVKAIPQIRTRFAFDVQLGAISLLFLLICLLTNWTESGFGKPTNLQWFLFLAVVISVPQWSIAGSRTSEAVDLNWEFEGGKA